LIAPSARRRQGAGQPEASGICAAQICRHFSRSAASAALAKNHFRKVARGSRGVRFWAEVAPDLNAAVFGETACPVEIFCGQFVGLKASVAALAGIFHMDSNLGDKYLDHAVLLLHSCWLARIAKSSVNRAGGLGGIRLPAAHYGRPCAVGDRAKGETVQLYDFPQKRGALCDGQQEVCKRGSVFRRSWADGDRRLGHNGRIRGLGSAIVDCFRDVVSPRAEAENRRPKPSTVQRYASNGSMVAEEAG
jgi:hypothetical protein